MGNEGPEPNSSSALLPNTKPYLPVDEAHQDIGSIADKVCNTAEITNCTLNPDRKRILEDVQSKIAQRQNTASSLYFVPQWLFDEALQKKV